MIDLAALSSLQAVARQGSVVGAAEELGFTPSAVSQQVKRLERQAGVALLERVGRGVMLTGHGRYLVQEGARVLGDLEQVESGLHRQTAEVAGHLRLAAFSTAMRGLVAPVVRDLLDVHPDLGLSLVEREPWETVDLVAAGLHDIGVAHTWGDLPLAVPDHLDAVVVADDVAEVVCHRDHPLATRAGLTPHDLVDEHWVATPDGTICRQWLTRMYAGTRRAPQIAHVALDFDSHLALVRSRLGIALVPRLGRGALGEDLVAIGVSDPEPTRSVIAVHRRTMRDSPAVQAVVAGLRAAGAMSS